MLCIWVTKPEGRPADLLRRMGIDVLEIADAGNVDRYVLSQRAVVERATGFGLPRRIADKTLFGSAIHMREQYEIPVLLVEGAVEYGYTAFHPQAVRGALSAMMLVYGVSVVSTPDVEETVALLAMMARHEQVGVPEISLIPKRKATDLPDLQRRLVEMLPGCGLSLARELLQRFGSIDRIVAAPEAALQEVRGIGTKRAAEIWRVLHASYRSLDTERDLEDAIEADPGLLFCGDVSLLARQHVIQGPNIGRQVVDMVFLDRVANEVILVELKRDALQPEHESQLLRYMAHAARSPLLQGYLASGTRLRGVLATATSCSYSPQQPDRVTVRIAERERAIDVLQRLRRASDGLTPGMP